ncbi:MAG TPA: hypothetical protein VGL56_19445 [Fimbriimonadaceae bacterium]|jgi:hypothetical protein
MMGAAIFLLASGGIVQASIPYSLLGFGILLLVLAILNFAKRDESISVLNGQIEWRKGKTVVLSCDSADVVAGSFIKTRVGTGDIFYELATRKRPLTWTITVGDSGTSDDLVAALQICANQPDGPVWKYGDR